MLGCWDAGIERQKDRKNAGIKHNAGMLECWDAGAENFFPTGRNMSWRLYILSSLCVAWLISARKKSRAGDAKDAEVVVSLADKIQNIAYLAIQSDRSHA